MHTHMHSCMHTHACMHTHTCTHTYMLAQLFFKLLHVQTCTCLITVLDPLAAFQVVVVFLFER